MTPNLGIEPGPHWWKASALTTAPSLHACKVKKKLFCFLAPVFCHRVRVFSYNGFRCFHQSICFTSQCRIVMGKLLQRTLSSPGNLRIASWSCVRHSRLTKINFYYLRSLYSPCVSFFNYQDPKPARNCIKLNKKIRSLNTVKEQLKLYETFKNSTDILHRCI